MTSPIPSSSHTPALDSLLPSPSASSIRSANKAKRTPKVGSDAAPETKVMVSDQWQNQPLKARRLGDQQIRLLNNVLELVEGAEVLLQAADQNKDQRLSRAELSAYRPAASETAEARFTQKALQHKLMHHFDAIDGKKDGVDSQDLENLRAQALGQGELIQNIAAVPVKEMALQESVREMPAPQPYTLTQTATPDALSNYRFESRFQPYGEAAVADLQQLDTQVNRYRLELPEQNALEMIQPVDPPPQHLLPTPESVAEAIAALPRVLQQYIHTVELNPLPYTFEIEGRKAADSADMTASPGGKITIYPRTQPTRVSGIYRTLIHESAHLMGFEKLGVVGTEKGWSAWREAMAEDDVAPSTYARLNGSQPGIEDFAEAATAWVLSQGQPEHEEWRELMPARFALLDSLLTGAPLEF
jgi:hypothetical protein